MLSTEQLKLAVGGKVGKGGSTYLASYWERDVRRAKCAEVGTVQTQPCQCICTALLHPAEGYFSSDSWNGAGPPLAQAAKCLVPASLPI